MNCEQVETLLTERARAGHAGAGADALDHLADCPRCAARLSEEQFASAALSAVVAEDAGMAAPAHVEAALLVAFRAQAERATQPGARTAARESAPPLPGWLWPRRAFAALAVAAALALLAVAALRFRLTPQQEPQTAATSAPSQPVAPQPRAASASPAQENKRREESATVKAPVHIARRAVAAGPRAVRRPATRAHEPAMELASVGEMVVVGRAPEAESVSEFVPLVGEGAPPLASGQLVRVELPRSALASLGLPLGPVGAGERIKADVLLGDDGLARAIRLVR